MAKTTFSPNTIAKSQEVNDNFEGAYDGTLDYDNNRLELTRQDALQNFVVSGLTIATSATLASTILAGSAYVSNGTYRKLVQKLTATAKTFTASKDTYVDMDASGNFYYVEVANGATAGMTLTANCIRIACVVTSATAITKVYQAASSSVAYSQETINRAWFDALGNAIYPTRSTNPFIGRKLWSGGSTSTTVALTAPEGNSWTVIIPTGGRMVRFSLWTQPSTTATNDRTRWLLKEGGSNIFYFIMVPSSVTGTNNDFYKEHETYLAAGSHTFTMELGRETGSGTVSAGAQCTMELVG